MVLVVYSFILPLFLLILIWECHQVISFLQLILLAPSHMLVLQLVLLLLLFGSSALVNCSCHWDIVNLCQPLCRLNLYFHVSYLTIDIPSGGGSLIVQDISTGYDILSLICDTGSFRCWESNSNPRQL